jgi:hypothetical protein
MESPSKQDFSEKEILNNQIAVLEENGELYGAVLVMTMQGLTHGIGNVRILYQTIPEGPAKETTKKAILDTIGTFFHSTYRTFHGKDSLPEAFELTEILLKTIEDHYDEQAAILQQNGPASSDADAESGERLG